MSKNLYLTATLLFSLFFGSVATAQSGCPGCVVNLPQLPEDTIYLSSAPDGEAGVYYDGNISFRMPKTTTPVNDPGTPADLNINKITIVSVVNVPPGLQWQPNKFEFDPQNETDGCVKFCGMPLQPGLYEVQVFVTAEVSIFNQSTSFSFPIYIAPATSSTDGFSMQNSAGCGGVEVSFQNNVPSGGNTGYSYFWDFGNGTSSSSENPGVQTYNSPGIYEVNYVANIDTFGFQLNTVQVLAAGCSDPISIPPNDAPDLYIKIKNPAGSVIFETSPIDNSPIPAAFNANMFLMEGDYKLEVRDDDLIGSQGCGEVTFNRFVLPTDTLVSGDLEIKLNIIHPISTIPSTDTVFVYEIPAPPVIMPFGQVEACAGDEVELMSDYLENLQWYQDTTLLLNENAPSLFVTVPGSYKVEYTSPEGCKSISGLVSVDFIPVPLAPSFHTEGNLLVINNTASLPAEFSLQWYVDGVLIPGATDVEYCMDTPGTLIYTLMVTDEATGCSNEFSLGATYNPSIGCTSSAGDMAALEHSLRVFPNPFQESLTFEYDSPMSQGIGLALLDATGRAVWEKRLEVPAGTYGERLALEGLPTGIYFLKVKTKDGAAVRKLLKNR
ncbi:MAG: T9SS type A sorting domain-containing protein [Saprospiraceae bacterium]